MIHIAVVWQAMYLLFGVLIHELRESSKFVLAPCWLFLVLTFRSFRISWMTVFQLLTLLVELLQVGIAFAADGRCKVFQFESLYKASLELFCDFLQCGVLVQSLDEDKEMVM